ncbi:MAG: hypothetical protein ACOYL8_02830 [Patescibacteria group bacterium]
MELRGINFGNVFAASGSLNFFGNGWWYHFWYKLLFPGFKEIKKCTFISKTTTLSPRAGNMPLKENLQPKELLPNCIKLYPLKGIVLNAVGLSGPGAKKLFAAGIWQKIEKPFFISFMPVAVNGIARLEEVKRFVELCKEELYKFKAPVGIQVNLSCPNTERKIDSTEDTELESETFSILEEFSKLNVPIDLKVNVFFSIRLLWKLEQALLCDVITVSNTIPFGHGAEEIDWMSLFPKGESPLQKYGGGGLSGQAILPIVLRRIKQIRSAGIQLPIKGGGGIMRAHDVNRMKLAGANAIEFATVAMLRPWRIKWIIKRAQEIF